jgi:hypothetical protein
VVGVNLHVGAYPAAGSRYHPNYNPPRAALFYIWINKRGGGPSIFKLLLFALKSARTKAISESLSILPYFRGISGAGEMMGLLMIDGVGWGAEWMDSVNEFYHLRMTLDTELQKSPAGRDTKRTLTVDPPLRTIPTEIDVNGSAVLDGRQGIVCVEDGERCVRAGDFKLTVQIDGLCSSRT